MQYLITSSVTSQNTAGRRVVSSCGSRSNANQSNHVWHHVNDIRRKHKPMENRVTSKAKSQVCSFPAGTESTASCSCRVTYLKSNENAPSSFISVVHIRLSGLRINKEAFCTASKSRRVTLHSKEQRRLLQSFIARVWVNCSFLLMWNVRFGKMQPVRLQYWGVCGS